MGNVCEVPAFLKREIPSWKDNLAELAERTRWDNVKLQVEEGDNINGKGGTEKAPALWYAALHLNKEMCEWLVFRGADPKAEDEVGAQPIHAAAAHEEGYYRMGSCQEPEEVIDFLLNCGVTTEEVDKDGRTPLHYANTVSACKSLIAHGANVYATDHKGDAAIHSFASENKSSVFAFILAQLANDLSERKAIGNRAIEIISQCYPSSQRAVMMAAIITHEAADPALLQANKPYMLKLANRCEDETAQSVLFSYLIETPGLQEVLDEALLKAAHYGTPERIFYLVSIGANVKCCDGKGNQPLHVASRSYVRHRLSLIKALIDCGASTTARNGKGMQPIHAALNDPGEVCQLLIKSGASVSEADNDGNQPIHLAIKNNVKDIVRVCLLLLENGASAIAVDKSGNQPLHLAVTYLKENILDVCKLFIDRCALVTAENKEGNQALHLAARRNLAAVCSFLIQEGAHVDSKNKKGNQPLHEAAKSGSEENCSVLIAGGANVNAANEKGNQPIHKGVRSGSLGVCRLLVSHGANVKAANFNGDQPLHEAAQMKNEEICKYFVDSGANPEAQNNNGDQPLHFLCKKEKDFWGKPSDCSAYNIANYFIARGAKASATNCEGDQPLHFLARTRSGLWPTDSSAVFRLLIETGGAKPKAPNNCGRHPLHKATGEIFSSFEILLSFYNDASEEDRKTIQEVFDLLCDLDKEANDHRENLNKMMKALVAKNAWIVQQYKSHALMKLVGIANVCHPVAYGNHVMAVASTLERTECEEVLTSALESVIADYSRDRFSLAGLILIGCGASLEKAHSLVLEAATSNFSKISAFLQDHCVRLQAETSEEKTLPQNLPEVNRSPLFSQLEAGTLTDFLSQETTVFLELNYEGPIPVGKQLPLRVIESLLKTKEEMKDVSQSRNYRKVCYGKGVFSGRIMSLRVATAKVPGSRASRPRASRPKLLSAGSKSNDSYLNCLLDKTKRNMIAVKVGEKWKDVARALRPTPLNDEEISCVELLHPSNAVTQCKAMLRFWSQNNSSAATIGNLCSSLLEVNCVVEAEEVFPDTVKELKQNKCAVATSL